MSLFRRAAPPVALLPLAFAAACAPAAPEESDEDDAFELPPLPDFVDDCEEGLNDRLSAPAGLSNENRTTYEGLALCDGEKDYYRIDIPPGRWVSVQMDIDGLGNRYDDSDLDLLEVDADDDVVWLSATDRTNYERLAWANPTDRPLAKYLVVDGAGDSAASYDLVIRSSSWHEGPDCDAFYEDEDPEDEDGPCNRILQFPKEELDSQGYFLQHEPHYSNLRREVAYLVEYASRATFQAFEGTNPLGLGDMSQRDGDTPGRMENRLRHPEGTHVDGNDIDIGYYQTSGDNALRPVCNNNGYFCTGDADDLDGERTAYFMARLLDSEMVRVIGVDPKVAEVLQDVSWDLVDDGKLTERDAQKLNGWSIAYGDGWPFHHHHMHLSWQWESGYERSAPPPDGCLLGPELRPAR